MTLSADGKTLLFREEGEAGGPELRRLSSQDRWFAGGSPGRRAIAGACLRMESGLSPAAATIKPICFFCPQGRENPSSWTATESFTARPCGFRTEPGFFSLEPNPIMASRLYVQDIATNKVDAISPEGTNGLSFALSPDGQFVAAVGPDEKGYLFPVASGDPKPIPGLQAGEVAGRVDCRRPFVVHLPRRRTAGQDLPLGYRQWQSNSLEATHASRSRGRGVRRPDSSRARRHGLRLRLSPPALGSLSGGRFEIDLCLRVVIRHCRGTTVGHSTTRILPSGSSVSDGE